MWLSILDHISLLTIYQPTAKNQQNCPCETPFTILPTLHCCLSLLHSIQFKFNSFLQVDILSRLHSPYLVQLLGYCADQRHRLLIFDYMPNGSLQQHLHPEASKSSMAVLNWGVRLRIALDCGRALEYLHDHTAPSVIHRHFKCTNVLLDQNFRAKVSDFGLAKIGSDKIDGLISTRVLGTTGYLAPEWVPALFLIAHCSLNMVTFFFV